MWIIRRPLSPGTALFINVALPNPDEITTSEKHYLRQVEICMMITLGSKQRSERGWNRLVREADGRLDAVNVSKSAVGGSV